MQVTQAQYTHYTHKMCIEITGEAWRERCLRYVRDYLDAVHWHADEAKTLEYLKRLSEQFETSGYRKIFFQIRKFLDYLGIEWASKLKAPKVRNKNNIKVYRAAHIREVYGLLCKRGDTRRYTAALLLAATSGIRAEELYALTPDDIVMAERMLYINASKTGERRVAFFNEEAARELASYLEEFKHDSNIKQLFGKIRMQKVFREMPLRVKHLRKFFSQECDRCGMPTSIKERLLGHSLNGNVDAQHYAVHDVDDLKKAYEKTDMHIFE
jgi:integrase/recombinase XerD